MSKFTFFLALPHSDDNILSYWAEELKGLEIEQRNDIWHLRAAKGQEFTADTLVGSDKRKGYYTFNLRKHTIRDNRGLVLGTKKSTAKEGTWDIWVVSPQGLDMNGDGRVDYGEWSTGTSVFRKLARFYSHAKNVKEDRYSMIGPWSALGFQREFGSDVDCVLYPEVPDKTSIDEEGRIVISSWKFIKDEVILPWVYFGESPEGLAKVDYKPSAADIRDDVEIKREELFEIAEVEMPSGGDLSK